MKFFNALLISLLVSAVILIGLEFVDALAFWHKLTIGGSIIVIGLLIGLMSGKSRTTPTTATPGTPSPNAGPPQMVGYDSVNHLMYWLKVGIITAIFCMAFIYFAYWFNDAMSNNFRNVYPAETAEAPLKLK